MKVLDRAARGGDWPLQDFRADVHPSLRATVTGVRVIGRNEDKTYVVGGHGDDTSPIPTAATLGGGFLIPHEPGEGRRVGSWSFGAPVILAEASKRPTGEEAGEQGSVTRDAAGQAAVRRSARVRPVRSEAWDEDTRFSSEFRVSIHPDAPDLPKGSTAIVMRGSEDDSEELLLLPIGPGTLRAVNRGPDAELSSTVFDTDASGSDDKRWNAKLHKVWRVARLGARVDGSPATEALAWQLTGPTRGLVVDSPSAPLRQPPPPSETDAVGINLFGNSSAGEGYFDASGRFVPQVYDSFFGKLGNYVGGTRTRSETSGTVARDPVQPDPASPAAAGQVYACVSAKAGGFLDVGTANDPHRLGLTEDGVPVNAAKISTGAVFRGGPGDGPLPFEVVLPQQATAHSYRSPVHLQWDESKTQILPSGKSHPGTWGLFAEVPFYTAEDRRGPGGYLPGGLQGLPGAGGPAGPGGPGGGPGGAGGGPGAGPPPGEPYGPYGPGGSQTWGGGAPNGPTGPAECHTLPSPQPGGADGTQGRPSGASGPTAEAGLGGLLGAALDAASAVGGVLSGLVPAPFAPGNAATPGVAVPPSGNDRSDQKRGDRWIDMGRALGIPAGAITAGGVVNLPPADIQVLQTLGVLDTQGRIAGSAPRIGDSIGRRLTIMGGATQRIPTTGSSLGIGGSLQLRATPWASGEIDVGVGGFASDELEAVQDRLPSVAAFTAFAGGDGTASGLGTTPRWGATPTADAPAVVLSPAELGNGEGLQAILAGDYATGGKSAGTKAPLTVFLPEGVVQLFVGQPSTTGGLGDGVLVSAGEDGETTLTGYTSGVAQSEVLTITPGTGIDIAGGSVTINGSPPGSGGGGGTGGFGGSEEDGAVTISEDTEAGAEINATSWSLPEAYTVYPLLNTPLVLKATGAVSILGTIHVAGRNYMEPA